MFSLSLLRLDIDFAALHNASIPQREASRPLGESEASSIVTENHLQTHKSNSCCGDFFFLFLFFPRGLVLEGSVWQQGQISFTTAERRRLASFFSQIASACDAAMITAVQLVQKHVMYYIHYKHIRKCIPLSVCLVRSRFSGKNSDGITRSGNRFP